MFSFYRQTLANDASPQHSILSCKVHEIYHYLQQSQGNMMNGSDSFGQAMLGQQVGSPSMSSFDSSSSSGGNFSSGMGWSSQSENMSYGPGAYGPRSVGANPNRPVGFNFSSMPRESRQTSNSAGQYPTDGFAPEKPSPPVKDGFAPETSSRSSDSGYSGFSSGNPQHANRSMNFAGSSGSPSPHSSRGVNSNTYTVGEYKSWDEIRQQQANAGSGGFRSWDEIRQAGAAGG